MDHTSTFDTWWADQSVVHPVGFAATAVLALGLLIVPRKWAVFPILAMACFMTPAQRIAIGGLDFTPARLLVVAGMLRIVVRGEIFRIRLQALDWILAAWAVVGTAAFVALHDSSRALTLKAGVMVDTVATYALARALIRDASDVCRVIVQIAALAVPVAGAFAVEAATGRNMFSVFGGVDEITAVRAGKLRCQGAFAHPILAGCFWASWLPVFAAGIWAGPSTKRWCLAGLVCAGVVILACASSTPLAGVAAGMAGASAFLFRRHMPLIKWGIPLVLIGLHLVMKAPVWHLLSRLDFVGGSAGWHRFYLVDQCIRRVGEWFWIGTPTTRHWGYGLQDVTNQYVAEAIGGGFLTLVLFIGTIWLAFRSVGTILRAAPDQPTAMMAWGLGTAVLVHVINYLGVSYFGQIVTIWYVQLAMIASLAALCSEVRARDPVTSWGSQALTQSGNMA